ncbi:MAG: IS91 family transposase [Actinomycetota bacterium]
MACQGRPRLEVADVVRAHGDDYRRARGTSADQQAVLSHIVHCRTAVLGGHLERCDSRSHERIAYNSCRDRHCPKCQATARAQWVTERLERLLPVPAFHVVFTIPAELNPLALHNKKIVFDILFHAAWQTLSTIASDPKHLGAHIGATAVLHTWGQNLQFHPHLHFVVTGGGLSADATRFIPGRQGYLLPVKVLTALFRGKFLDALDRAHRSGRLGCSGTTASLSDPHTWRCFKDGLYKTDWIVYAKPPFGGAEHVFAYLGNYTHRIAISNHRLVELSDGKVSFWWKDYAHAGARKVMTLEAVEFLRRFLLHVLPSGYVRIRHYGLYASRNVTGKLETARRLLAAPVSSPATLDRKPTARTTDPQPWWERFREQTGVDVMACPSCLLGRMRREHALSPVEAAIIAERLAVDYVDTS